MKKSEHIKIFLSYSRIDGEFTKRLADALLSRGYHPDYDQASYDPENIISGIAAEDEWWQRLKEMIIQADTVIFVVSPDSASSQVCDEEIAWARDHGKRVIPILRRPIVFAKAPPRLSALNIKIDFTSNDVYSFNKSLDQLCKAIDVDVKWYRQHTKLTSLLTEWQEAGKTEEHLLSETNQRTLSILLEQRPSTVSEPSESLLEFLDESRKRLDRRNENLRKTIGRGFLAAAEQGLEKGQPAAALHYIAAGSILANDPNFELVPELYPKVFEAIRPNRYGTLIRRYTDVGATKALIVSPDGSSVAVIGPADRYSGKDDSVHVLDLETGNVLAQYAFKSYELEALTFYLQNTLIAIISDGDGTQIRDLHSGTEIMSLEKYGRFYCPTFSHDGTMAAFYTEDSHVNIVSIVKREELARIPVTENFVEVLTDLALAFSPDSTSIAATFNEGLVRNYDLLSGTVLAEYSHGAAVQAILFSPNGSQIVTADETESKARIFDTKSGKEIFQFSIDLQWFNNEGRLCAMAFSSNSANIVVNGNDYIVRVFDVFTGSELVQFPHEDRVKALSITPDSNRVVTIDSRKIARVFDIKSGTELVTLGHDEWLHTVTFGLNGSLLLTGSGGYTLQFFDIAPSAELLCLHHDKTVGMVTFSPDGSHLASTDESGTTQVLEISTGTTVARYSSQTESEASIAFSSQNSAIASHLDKEMVRIFDVYTGEIILDFANDRECHVLTLSPDGALLATGNESGRIRITDTTSGDQISEVDIGEYFSEIVFSPDSSCFATKGGRGEWKIHVYDSLTGRKIESIYYPGSNEDDSIAAIAISPNRNSIATGSSIQTSVFDLESQHRTFREYERDDNPIWAVVFSPDGTRLATGSPKSARIYDLDTNIEIAKFPHTSHVVTMAFSPCGTYLATGSADKMMRLWDISRLSAYQGDNAIYLAAALADGCGSRFSNDYYSLIMKDAPYDLYVAYLISWLRKLQQETSTELEVSDSASKEELEYALREYYPDKWILLQQNIQVLRRPLGSRAYTMPSLIH